MILLLKLTLAGSLHCQPFRLAAKEIEAPLIFIKEGCNLMILLLRLTLAGNPHCQPFRLAAKEIEAPLIFIKEGFNIMILLLRLRGTRVSHQSTRLL